MGAGRLRHEQCAADAYTDAAVRVDQGHAARRRQLVGKREPASADGAGRFPGRGGLHLRAAATTDPARKRRRPRPSIAKAVTWLESAKPETTQDRAFQALALAWACGEFRERENRARARSPMQRADGGWSQFPGMETDAYATGQALFALNIAGRMAGRSRLPERHRLSDADAGGRWHVAREDARRSGCSRTSRAVSRTAAISSSRRPARRGRRWRSPPSRPLGRRRCSSHNDACNSLFELAGVQRARSVPQTVHLSRGWKRMANSLHRHG